MFIAGLANLRLDRGGFVSRAILWSAIAVCCDNKID